MDPFLTTDQAETKIMNETRAADGVYFDNNATTPLDPRVLRAMLPSLGPDHGNPSSAHGFGRAARRAVERSRRQVAELVGGVPEEVIFTASGSEANNAVIFDVARRNRGPGGHLVLASFEHPSVVRAAEEAELLGLTLTRVSPNLDGVVAAAAVAAAVRPDTRLVCLMLANNELGTLQPVREVAAACRQRGIPVLCDAVQAVGKVEVKASDLGVDFLTLGAHKFHGPLGAAALWLRKGQPLEPFVVGAAQEGGRRAGTENVPAIVGLGEACALAVAELETRHRDLAALRDRLEAGLATIPEARIHGAAIPRLPHTTNVAFPGLVAADLMAALDRCGFAVSTGAACSSGKALPSATLLAMGLPPEEAVASLRISFGITNTAEEVDRFLAILPGEVERLRAGAVR